LLISFSFLKISGNEILGEEKNKNFLCSVARLITKKYKTKITSSQTSAQRRKGGKKRGQGKKKKDFVVLIFY
jgi:hypothetical protein